MRAASCPLSLNNGWTKERVLKRHTILFLLGYLPLTVQGQYVYPYAYAMAIPATPGWT